MNYKVKPILPVSFGKNSAVFSIILPVVSIGLYMAIAIVSMPKPWCSPVLAATALVLAWAGLLSAFSGIVRGLWGRGITVVLIAFMGLLLNAGILAPVIGVELPIFGGVAGRSNPVTLVQLNSLPQVFENSETVIDSKFDFRLELPAGFVKNPDPVSSPKIIHSYVRGDEKGLPAVTVTIERLHEVLPLRKNTLVVEDLEKFKTEIRKIQPYAAITKIEQGHWKSHSLNLYLVETPEKGDMICTWCVNVPLAGEAISIKVGGLKGSEEQNRRILAYMLKSLRGTSNWD